jgi:hypothetical protein
MSTFKRVKIESIGNSHKSELMQLPTSAQSCHFRTKNEAFGPKITYATCLKMTSRGIEALKGTTFA